MKEPKIVTKQPTVYQFNYLRESVGWGKLDEKVVSIGLKNSIFSVCAFIDKDIIGHCRLVGDNALKMYIEELMVHPSYQKKGIGTKIMNIIMNYIKTNYTKCCTVSLFSNRDLDFFYERFGFVRRKSNMPGMQYRWEDKVVI